MRTLFLKPLQRFFTEKKFRSLQARRNLSRLVVAKALALGASSAGIADVKALRGSPSQKAAAIVRWPADAESAIVMALEHPPDRPLLDWWDGRSGQTPGNRRLIQIGKALVQWLKKEHRIDARGVPYQIHKGGIFAKDAAVLAGLGIIGRNNLLITPAFGPRVRLRAVLLTVKLVPSAPLDFAPCRLCAAPCLSICPQNAFQSGIYESDLCNVQMRLDEAARRLGKDRGLASIRYCRACELACPVNRRPGLRA